MHIESRKNQPSVWPLEANGNDQWTIDHTASFCKFLEDAVAETMSSTHPERNLIFFAGAEHDDLVILYGRQGKLCALFKNIFWSHVFLVFSVLWTGVRMVS